MLKFKHLPSLFTQKSEQGLALKRLFFNLIDSRVYNFIAKKVSKLNGDIRVAFDLMKSSLLKL